MRNSLLILLALCALINLASAFKKSHGVPGGYYEIDLSNPPDDYLQVVTYIKTHFQSDCRSLKLNSSVQLTEVERAAAQIVAGKNYEIVFTAVHHTEDHITVQAFQALPDKNRVQRVEITHCK